MDARIKQEDKVVTLIVECDTIENATKYYGMLRDLFTNVKKGNPSKR